MTIIEQTRQLTYERHRLDVQCAIENLDRAGTDFAWAASVAHEDRTLCGELVATGYLRVELAASYLGDWKWKP